jgi:polyphenol oxidase
MKTGKKSFAFDSVGTLTTLRHVDWYNSGFEHGFIGSNANLRAPVSKAVVDQFRAQFGVASLLLVNQKHTSEVYTLIESPLPKEHLVLVEGEHDALVASIKALSTPIALGIRTADCVPILIKHGDCYGAVHAGWRGLAQEIIAKTCAEMQKVSASDNSRWQFLIGPCAGVEHYEIGEDILGEFLTPPCVERRDPNLYLDLSRTATQQIQDWLQTESAQGEVMTSQICTISERSFHSYRRDKEQRGSNLSFIILRPAC